MKEVRCKSCHKLLAVVRKGKIEQQQEVTLAENSCCLEIDIKCNKCKVTNSITRLELLTG